MVSIGWELGAKRKWVGWGTRAIVAAAVMDVRKGWWAVVVTDKCDKYWWHRARFPFIEWDGNFQGSAALASSNTFWHTYLQQYFEWKLCGFHAYSVVTSNHKLLLKHSYSNSREQMVICKPSIFLTFSQFSFPFSNISQTTSPFHGISNEVDYLRLSIQQQSY